MKRMMQRQGQLEADGSPASAAKRTAGQPRPRPPAANEVSGRARIVEFFRDVRSELRQVAWPTRSEVVNSATVVFIVLVILAVLIFALNYAFSHAVIKLFST